MKASSGTVSGVYLGLQSQWKAFHGHDAAEATDILQHLCAEKQQVESEGGREATFLRDFRLPDPSSWKWNVFFLSVLFGLQSLTYARQALYCVAPPHP